MTMAVAVQRDGGTFYLEVEDDKTLEIVGSDADMEGTAGVGEIIERLDRVATTIVEVCSSLHQKAYAAMGDLRPDSFEVEFGVKLAGEAGVPLVTKGDASAPSRSLQNGNPPPPPLPGPPRRGSRCATSSPGG